LDRCRDGAMSYVDPLLRGGQNWMQMGQTHATDFPLAAPQSSHFPDVDRTVVAVAKEFTAYTRTGMHSHARGQIAFAIRGVMEATTETGAWIVPTGYAFWVPAGVAHDVAMHSDVSMRTAYLRVEDRHELPDVSRVVRVTPLLETALVALS